MTEVVDERTAEKSEAAEAEQRKAGVKEWIGLGVLGLPTLILSLDFSMLHLALPHLTADLQASSTQQLWILDIYGFMIAGFLITMGGVGDRIGRRKLLLVGSAIFGILSVLAAFAQSAYMLIAMRALLGIAGATLMPSTLALIHNMFHHPHQRAMAISVWMVCFSAGGVLGPAVGGILLEYFWWGSVFLLGVPVMLLLLVTGPFLLPEYKGTSTAKIDIWSVILSLAAVLFAVFGLKELSGESGWLLAIAWIAVGALLGWLFVRRQLKLQSPLVDVTMFRHRTFSASLIMLLVGMITLGAFVLMFTQYLQLMAGLPPLVAGLWMMPYAVGSIVGIMATPILVRRISATTLIVAGIFITCLGFAIIIAYAPAAQIAMPVIGSFILVLGLGPLQILTIDFVVSSAPAEKAGSASSLSEMCGELGMASGVAIFGTIIATIYRWTMQMPEAIPPSAIEASSQSLAGATAVAQSLPAETANQLLEAGRTAFAGGMQAASVISILVLLMIAWTAWRLRMRLHPS